MIQNFTIFNPKIPKFLRKVYYFISFDVAPLVVEETWPDNRSQL